MTGPELTDEQIALAIYRGIQSCMPVDLMSKRMDDYAAIWANAGTRNVRALLEPQDSEGTT